jgi:hypothetical protein
MTWILPKQLHISACALDTEALSLDSTESSQICAQSLFVRSKVLPSRTWSQKWKRDSWTRHLSGRILKPSLGEHFATAWTSSLGDTPVSRLVPLESEQGKTIHATSGLGLQMELLQCDQVSVSLKMSKDISRWGCPTSSKTWEEWVTEQRGAYSARLKSALLTNGSGSSSWPTVTVAEAGKISNCANHGQKGLSNHPVIRGEVGRNKQAKSRSGLQDRRNLSGNGSRGGLLNEEWVEALMGVARGWTDCDCLGTESSRQRQNWRSEF